MRAFGGGLRLAAIDQEAVASLSQASSSVFGDNAVRLSCGAAQPNARLMQRSFSQPVSGPPLSGELNCCRRRFPLFFEAIYVSAFGPSFC